MRDAATVVSLSAASYKQSAKSSFMHTAHLIISEQTGTPHSSAKCAKLCFDLYELIGHNSVSQEVEYCFFAFHILMSALKWLPAQCWI